MKEKIILGIFVLGLILLAGCEEVDLSKVSDEDLERVAGKIIVCEKPYIRHAMGCCLDENDNGICDKDEEKIVKELFPRCITSTGSGIFCSDFVIDIHGITLRLKNFLTETINVESITTHDGECKSESGTIAPYEITDFLLSCSLTVGEIIDKDFTINYNVEGSSKTTGGTVSDAVVEERAEQLLPEKCVISTSSGLWCDDFSIDSSSTVRINLKNILTDDITSITATLTNTGGGTGSCTGTLATLTAGSTGVVTLTCDPVLSEKVKADLEISYTANSFPKTTTGSITSRVP